MNERLLELAHRHGALQARIAEQRRQLAQHVVPIEAALARGDALRHALAWLKAHPGAVGSAVAVAVVLRPRRMWRWARRGFVLWRGWQAVRQSFVRWAGNA